MSNLCLRRLFPRKILPLVLVVWNCSVAAQTPSDAQSMQARGDWSGAESAWRKLIQREPADYRLWASLGIVLAQENRYSEAITAYRKALSLKPNDAQTDLNLGIASFKAGLFTDALAPLRSAVRALGDSPKTDVLLGMSLFGARQYREASAYLQRSLAQDPHNLELQRALAESFLYSAQYEKAMAQFEVMLRDDPDSPVVHMLLAEAYDATNKPEKAIEELRAALAKGDLPNGYFGLGYLLWKEHRYDEAAAAFKEELKRDPNNSQALAYLGDVALTQSDPKQAEQLLRRSIGLRTETRLAFLDLGALESEAKNFDDAEKNLKHAVVLDPNQADAHYRLARLYQAEGRRSDAERELALVKQLHETKRDDLLLKISGPRQ